MHLSHFAVGLRRSVSRQDFAARWRAIAPVGEGEVSGGMPAGLDPPAGLPVPLHLEQCARPIAARLR